MAEIKRTFTAGRMNKDLDERLVPNGEYRDAYNVQVRTSSGDDAGAVQNLQGNEQVGQTAYNVAVSSSKCIGSIADEKNDKAYFLFASEDLDLSDPQGLSSEKRYIDYIIEQTSNGFSNKVVVDVFAIMSPFGSIVGSTNTASGSSWDILTVEDGTKFRPGMTVKAFNDNNVNILKEDTKILKISGNELYLNQLQTNPVDNTTVETFLFEAPKTLGFKQSVLVTAINVIDDYLLWSTGDSEPRKISISRCKAGSSNDLDHTELYVEVGGTLVQASEAEPVVLDNIIQNGTFENSNHWDVNNATISNNQLAMGNASRAIYLPDYYRSVSNQIRSTLEVGKKYSFTVEVISGTATKLQISGTTDGQTFNYAQIDASSTGFKTVTFKATAGLLSINTGGQNSTVVLDNISLSEIREDKTVYLEEKHTTVIRTSPRVAPAAIENTQVNGNKKWFIDSYTGFTNEDGNAVGPNTSGVISGLPDYASFLPGDVIKLTTIDPTENEKYSVIVRVTDIVDDNLYYVVVSINTKIKSTHVSWNAELDDTSENLFEQKFVRFATRYKYSDGEYSTFSPFSKIVFSPGSFSYDSKSNYNLGMVNRIKEITLENVVPNENVRPEDVVAVEVLFKSTDNASVYVVKTINKGIDAEWISGKLSITTEMMHQVVPNDQLLRAWDNVPKTAKSQELISNRLVYGNYTQGYDLSFKPSIQQYLNSKSEASVNNPKRSIKSSRSYKVGLVFGDKYGRETPVVALNNKSYNDGDTTYNKAFDNFTVDKAYSSKNSNIVVKQDWTESLGSSNKPDDWIDYVKYYVKETSQEYYNLVMDRWYEAEDGNIWVSFASSDRNKVDENTFLILKNAHGYDEVVPDLVKYKVLSIENEAPNSIKSTLKTIGNFSIPDGYFQTYVGDGMDRLTDNLELVIDPEDYAIFGKKGINFKGNPKVRLVLEVGSTILKTPPKEIKMFLEPVIDTESSLSGKITINSPFGELADFYNLLVKDGVYADISAAKNAVGYDKQGTIKYEILDEVIQSSPEFEGKFFVKIERDVQLDDYVTSRSSNTGDYELVDSINIGYIDTGNAINPASAGSESTYEWGDNEGYNGLGNPFSSSEITNNLFAKCSEDEDTALFWQRYAYLNIKSKYPMIGAFIDAAHTYSEDSDTATPDRKQALGLHASDNCREGLDTLTLSIPILPKWSTQTTIDGDAFKLMTRPGTVFSFNSDDRRTKYRIRSVESYVVRNYGDSENNCQPCVPDNSETEYIWVGSTRPNATRTKVYTSTLKGSWCRRRTYKVSFEKLNEEGVIIPFTGIDIDQFDPRGHVTHDGTKSMPIELYSSNSLSNFEKSTNVENPAIWETEPKQSTELDVYYEASNAIPMVLNETNIYEFAPKNSKISFIENSGNNPTYKDYYVNDVKVEGLFDGSVSLKKNNGDVFYDISINDILVFEHLDGTKTRTKVLEFGSINNDYFKSGATVTGLTATYNTSSANITVSNTTDLSIGMKVIGVEGHFSRDASIENIVGTTVTITSNPLIDSQVSGDAIEFAEYGGAFRVDKDVYKYNVDLPWFNCFSFGNGVESNRIRDDFNAPTINNGVKVSSTFLEYQEEVKSNGLIYSGIFNSTSSVNKLNEFNMSQKITKDINPDYGSIQALKSRNTDLNVFTEDKVLKVLANKDALYNADGNVNITSTDRVLGQAIPYAGDYGISKNPESLASDQYRIYFTDKQRGAVLRLSNDGLTPISNVGMKNWFRDNLRDSERVIGSFDIVNGEYNLTINPLASSQKASSTVSFNEGSKGWVSFKSFIKESGISVAGQYYTTKNNKIYKHYSSTANRNTFYGTHANSSLTVLIND